MDVSTFEYLCSTLAPDLLLLLLACCNPVAEHRTEEVGEEGGSPRGEAPGSGRVAPEMVMARSDDRGDEVGQEQGQGQGARRELAMETREGDAWVGPVPCKHGLPTSSPSTYEKKSTSPCHLPAAKIAACVVNGGPPRLIRGPGSACLPPVWYGPHINHNASTCFTVVVMKLCPDYSGNGWENGCLILVNTPVLMFVCLCRFNSIVEWKLELDHRCCNSIPM